MRFPCVAISLALILSVAEISTSAFQIGPPSCPSLSGVNRRLLTPQSTYDWTRSYASKSTSSNAESTEKVPTLSIHSLLEKGRIDDAVKELRNSGDIGVPASTYHAVIEACSAGGIEPNQRGKKKPSSGNKKNDRIDIAVELLESMDDDVTVHAHEIIISGYARRGKWQDAYRTLTAMEELLDSSDDAASDGKGHLNIYQTVLMAFAKANQFNHMNSLLTRMRRRSVRPNVYTYNSLLKICASDKVPRWKEALSILSQCQREPGVDPDLITYTTTMKACARGRQAGKAMELFRVVKDMDMELDVYVYTTAMDACAKGRQWRKALSLMDEMKGKGISPNEVTYGVAVAACGNGGKWERALELLDQMRAMDLKINTITYNSAIAALAKAARTELKQHMGGAGADIYWQKALGLVESMKNEGVRRDSFTFSSAISTCGPAGRWEEALSLIKAMKGDGTKPNQVTYTAAITACANSRQWDPAFELFNEMKNDRLKPDIIAYNALIGAGMAAEKPVEVFDLWQEIQKSKDISPDIVTLTEVISTLDKVIGKASRERVDNVFVEAVSRGLILRKDSLDTSWEVDLSKMRSPVARAACRYIFKQIVESHPDSEDEAVKDLNLITGPGRMREYVREVLRDELKPDVYCVVPKLEQGTLQVKEQMIRNFIAGQGKQ